jgi:hypothetical protein
MARRVRRFYHAARASLWDLPLIAYAIADGSFAQAGFTLGAGLASRQRDQEGESAFLAASPFWEMSGLRFGLSSVCRSCANGWRAAKSSQSR